MRSCRAALYSEYFLISRSGRLIFLGTVATHTCVLLSPLFECSSGSPFLALLHGPTLIFVVNVFGFAKHEGPYCQHVAEWGYLPGVVHRGLHVVLPSVRWSNVL